MNPQKYDYRNKYDILESETMEIVDIKHILVQDDILKVLAESVYMPSEDKLKNRADKYRSDQNIIAYGMRIESIYYGVIVLDISDPKHPIINNIAVAKPHQKQGIGTLLIQHVRRVLHPEEIIAETDNDAVEFYRNIGFHIINLGEKYPGIQRYECRLNCRDY